MQDLTPQSGNRRQRRAAKSGKRNAAAPAAGQLPDISVSNSSDRALRAAFKRHGNGDLDGAEADYRAILARDPEHPDSLHLLGVLLTQRYKDGDAEALSLLARASEALPDNAQVAMHHGVALRNAGDLAAAEQELQRALALGLDSADAHNNLATIHVRQNRIDAARAALKAALARDPEHGPARRNLTALDAQENPTTEQIGRQEIKHAIQCANSGDYIEAIKSIHRASNFITLTNENRYMLGECLRCSGDRTAAWLEFDKLAVMAPDYIRAIYGQALVEYDRGRYVETINLLDQIPEEDENFGDALYLRACCLRNLKRVVEAEHFFKRASELMPDNGIVFNDHGVLMQQQHRNAEAIMLFLKGIQVDPKHRQLYVNLGNSLQNHGRALDAVEMYQHALQHCGDNPNLRSNLLFCLNYISSLTRETVFAEHQAFRPLLKTKPLAAVKARDLDPHRRLRIGYVSADFKRHSCARFFEPVLFGHNRNRMEVTLYSNVDVGDTTTERFKQAADRWRDVKSMDDHEAAEQIRDDGIDILVEMNGHTSGHRLSLFALKPAPVQISWLGYPNTTGVPEIDYRLSDEITDPSGEADAYSTERIVRMPNGFHCFAPEFPGIPVSPSPCLDNRHVTFGSFNYLAKIGDPVIDAWTQILDRIPNSRLVMKARGLSDLLCRDTYLEHFEARGIDRQRIDIVPYTPRTEDHLALYGRIDIALDPFPYNGTTTTCEAMWMGVPVVALLGESHAARVSASLMTRVGLEPLVGADILDYVERAVELASDTNRLAQLRQDIRPAMTASPLMDAAGFVRDLEAVYRDVWEAYCSRESA